jgi:hypothetical protein
MICNYHMLFPCLFDLTIQIRPQRPFVALRLEDPNVLLQDFCPLLGITA